MLFYRLGWTFAVILAGISAAAAAPLEDVSDLLQNYAVLNDHCRGGSGDEPATQKYCAERDRVFNELKAQGWCWGRPSDQYEYQKRWQPCEPPSVPPAGTSSGGTSKYRVGPSFDCSMPSIATQPLAQMICRNDELAAADLSYVMAYQALREGMDDPQQKALRDEANAFIRKVYEQCDLPRAGKLERSVYNREITCIRILYATRRAMLLGRLKGDALEETLLSPEQAQEIQRLLISRDFLSAQAPVDGLFGPATRAAISRWQSSVGLRSTGFASKAMLDALSHAQPSPAAPSTSATPAPGRTASSSSSPQQQRIDDARALTKKMWRSDLELIRRVEIGLKCGVLDQVSADFAVRAISIMMDDEMINNGLINDRSMNVYEEVKKAIEDGRLIANLKADPAFCSKFFTPADRERLRQMVESLMR